MMSGMMDCAFGGAWLMGLAAILILLVLAISVAGLIWFCRQPANRGGALNQNDR